MLSSRGGARETLEVRFETEDSSDMSSQGARSNGLLPHLTGGLVVIGMIFSASKRENPWARSDKSMMHWALSSSADSLSVTHRRPLDSGRRSTARGPSHMVGTGME